MDKIKTVKIKNPDGSVSEETYTISVDAKDVDMKNGKDLQDTIGDINVDRDGSIAEQLGKYKDYDSDIETLYADVDSLEAADTELENDIIDLQINKINKNDIVDNLDSTSATKVLSANQGKVLGDAVAALEAERVKKKPYYFDTVANMKVANLKDGDYVCTLGYYTANDGGGAFYKITDTASITDYQEEIGELYATLLINDYIIPEQLGAYGDGSHDDTSVFETLFSLGKSIKCLPDSIYGIKNCNMGTNNIDFDGNGCTFLNLLKDVSSIPQNIYTTSMLYAGQVTGTIGATSPNPNISLRNFTIDAKCDDMINFTNSWVYAVSLVFPNKVFLKNITVKNTLQTAFGIYGCRNCYCDDCIFENISMRTDQALEGASRNCFEFDASTYLASLEEHPVFHGNNIVCKNVYDMFMRCDNIRFGTITNSVFENVGGAVIEQHFTRNTTVTPSHRNIVISNCKGNGCGTILTTSSTNDSSNYTSTYEINNCDFINCVGTTSGGVINLSGVGTKLYLSDSNIVIGEDGGYAYGVLYGEKGCNYYINNCTLDGSNFGSSLRSVLTTITTTYCNYTINNSKLISGNTTNSRILDSRNSSTGIGLKIYNSELVGAINGQLNDLLLDNVKQTTGGYIIYNSIVATNCVIKNSTLISTATSGWIFQPTATGSTNMLIENNIIDFDTDHGGYFFIYPSSNYFTLINNKMIHNYNLGPTIELVSGSHSIIADNLMNNCKYSGTPTIIHDNVGLTVSE